MLTSKMAGKSRLKVASQYDMRRIAARRNRFQCKCERHIANPPSGLYTVHKRWGKDMMCSSSTYCSLSNMLQTLQILNMNILDSLLGGLGLNLKALGKVHACF